MVQRWIVDGMNVIGSRPDGWWNDRRTAMREFALALDEHARSTDKDLTVVFDQDPGSLSETMQIKVVVASRRGPNAADFEIERLVKNDQDPASLRVVTSDRGLIEQITATGATVVSSGTFRNEIPY